MILQQLLTAVAARVAAFPREELGAIGWLILGVILGVILVIFAVVKLLIPGE